MLVATIAVAILVIIVVVLVIKKKEHDAADLAFQKEPAAGMVGIEMPVTIHFNPLAKSRRSRVMSSTSAFVLKEWLNSVGMGEYEASLRDEGFDNVSSLRDLEKDDLKEIGVAKLAHRKAIMKAIALL